jgi:3-deoxy-D-manno-octulosonate 8-phosphate phosphatase (KDO 8-P phosphatase)
MNIIDFQQIKNLFQGNFLALPNTIQSKLFKAKAFVFDWDGVFNNGMKNENGSSPFSEVDSVGTNLLRFNQYLRNNHNPITAIITGERNNTAFSFAKREHFHSVYYSIKNKKEALLHLCDAHDLKEQEIVYFFDDVLDLSVAELCGLRIMVSRACNPLLLELVRKNKLADYLTVADGGNNALREASELLIGLSGRYHDTIMNRVNYSALYQEYLGIRDVPVPSFYTSVQAKITEQTPL